MHNANDITLQLDDEAATLACGVRFAKILQPDITVYLHGDLGAGKTTFTRGVLQGLGHIGKVKSPTYTLVEIYALQHNIEFNVNSSYNLYHFDLYRFTSDEEWDAAGFRDYFNAHSICMIEWPENAAHLLPQPDIHVYLSLHNTGRVINFNFGTVLGSACLENL